MSRIREGHLYLQLRNKGISIKKFLGKYEELKEGELKNFKEVTENELGKFKEHEIAHGQVWKKREIRVKYYLSLDGTMAMTMPDKDEYYSWVSKLAHDEFIELLKELHNPQGIEPSRLEGTDFLIYQILIGNYSEKDIETYAIREATKI